MVNFPDRPIKPIHHDLHYHLLPHVQLARELKAGSDNLIQGRLENARSHAMAIDGQVVNGTNAALGEAFSVTRSLAKRLHDAITKGLDSALRKTGTLEHRASTQSEARGEPMPPALHGPDLEAALQVDSEPTDVEIDASGLHITWLEIDIQG